MFAFSSLKIVPPVLAAGLISAGCTAAISDTVIALPDTQCEVVLNDKGRTILIEAKIHTTIDASGSYRLNIRKTGSNGSANISQGGTFNLLAGQSKTVGASSMSGKMRDIEATMTVISNGEELSCITSKDI